MDIEKLKELRAILERNSELEDEQIETLWELIDTAIARQSVKSEEVQEAIDILIDWDNENFEDRSVGIYIDSDMKFAVPLAIAALKEYQPCIPKK